MKNLLRNPTPGVTKKESTITAKEFLENVQPDEKAEYIDGEVIMHSPAMSYHSIVRRNIEFYIHEHVSYLKKGMVESEKAMIRLGNNYFEPDVIYWDETITIDKKTMIHPVPHFVVEVLSDSTEGRDRNIKKEHYEKYNIPEYWIVDTETERIEQYLINPVTKKYFLYKWYQKKDTIKSRVIEDLVIPLKAIFTYKTLTGDYQILIKKRVKHSLKKERDKRIKAEQEKIKAEATTEQEKQERIKAEATTEQEKQERIKAEATAEQEKQERIKAEAIAEQEKQERIKAEAATEQEKQERIKAEATTEQETQKRIKAEQERTEQQNRAERAEAEIAKLKAEFKQTKK